MSKTRTPGVNRIAFTAAVLVVVAAAWGAVEFWPPAGPASAPAAAPVVEPADTPAASADGLTLPKKAGSLRFAVMGDVGRGDAAQYDTANEMARWHEKFDFSFVLMLGDNIYGDSGSHDAYAARFERPYKALFDHGVTFYAALGNHDPPGQPFYRPFNMNGNRYYRITKKEGAPLAGHDVDFYALDTVTLDRDQLSWLRRMLGASTATWKIAFYHHPLYTSGRYRLSASQLRRRLEPTFDEFGIDVGLSGHEHFYERVVPQNGILYFTSGGGGALRKGDLSRSSLTAAGFDQDTHFMLFEISGDTLYFQAIGRTGQTVDSGKFDRVKHAAPPPVLRQ